MHPVVFLVDVDNTLLDNGRIQRDLRDHLFQPRNVEQSGLFEAADGRVLIYIHKERELDDIAARYPANHYVLVDDKLRILAAVKQAWGEKVTTVFPRQDIYARDPAVLAAFPPADVAVDRIGELVECEVRALCPMLLFECLSQRSFSRFP